MTGFIDRAKEQAQRGLAEGKKKIDEAHAHRAGSDLLKKLGAAYYAERSGSGSPEATREALGKLEAHVNAHGDGSIHS
ncbi:hypothetical protein [Streptomyces chattanoogensis]|uniref:hypothetical protein n=1 Tax=Streptomyces chattanoogensis TaxID=66876 RepID=UPI0005D864EB|nr:hypothetical protein T261_2797 [Streptomyces lydicus]